MKIKDLVQQHGIENIRVQFPSKRGVFDNATMVWGRLSEGHFKIEQNHKVLLVPDEAEYNSQEYYIRDLESLIDEDVIVIEVSNET